jgi:hypothetical protein
MITLSLPWEIYSLIGHHNGYEKPKRPPLEQNPYGHVYNNFSPKMVTRLQPI